MQPVGADAPLPVDVRVVATSNRDLLAREVEAGASAVISTTAWPVVGIDVPAAASAQGATCGG